MTKLTGSELEDFIKKVNLELVVPQVEKLPGVTLNTQLDNLRLAFRMWGSLMVLFFLFALQSPLSFLYLVGYLIFLLEHFTL